MQIRIPLTLLLIVLVMGCVGPADIPVQNQTENSTLDAQTEPIPEPASEVVDDNMTEETAVIEVGPQSVYVSLIEGGFEVPEVRIKVGETVGWKNEREGRQQRAMILGTQWCSFVRSGFFGPGEVYRATFTRTGTCTVVDGMYTTEMMKVIVE
ncbi:MAG TPA: hypothetical protein VJI32_01380 [Candidatus Nanoarchaeia archaeon]|nr:hypothetical protein [Candidatus Nanoarchaeia archaeon]